MANRFLKGYLQDLVFMLDSVGIHWDKVKDVKYLWRRFTFNKSQQLDFIIDFASFYKTGSAKHAADSIISGVEKSNDKPLKALVAKDILKALNEGKEVSDGMKRWFDKDALQIYKAGEQAGNIEEVLSIYAQQFTQIKEFKKSLFAGVKMPLLLIFMGLAGYYAMAEAEWLGFPSFKPVTGWLPPAQFAYELSYKVHNNVLALLAIPIILKAYNIFCNSVTHPLRLKLDSGFPLSLFKGFEALRLIKMYTVLKTAYCGDYQAVQIIHENSGKYTQHYTTLMKESLHKGVADMGSVLDVNLLPPRLLSRIHAVSQANGQEAKIRALTSASSYAEKEIAFTLARSKSLLTLFAWIVGGFLLGSLMIGFMTTSLSISQQ
ncbi:type II secretion system F family protein [Alteromonas antoniana]|uniref:type II secretion system F family protein n=1 Tax=Alteromonas antoniana TaxID=2803813 RepID=UPI001C46DB17|nr:type II secretion system F family protein [Alteromonas antoniana]